MSDPPKASQNEYWSVDSQPAKLSGRVPLWKAPAVLVTFTVLGALSLVVLQNDALLGSFFTANDWVFAPVPGQHFIAIRHFLLAFFVSFGLFANGSAIVCLKFIADLVGSFLAICLAIDLLSIFLWQAFDVPISLRNLQIATGLIGFAVFSARLYTWGEMPAPVHMAVTPAHPLRSFGRFGVLVVLAGVLSWWVNKLDLQSVSWLRGRALLGGLGPGVFLFLPSLFFMMYLLAVWDRRKEKETKDFAPDVTIVIPAHNEEYIIAATLQAIDKAAERYSGQVTVYVVNNNSIDGTFAVANTTFDHFAYAKGRVINEPRPGKAHALNTGFAAVTTDLVIRIDADTQIDPDSLRFALRHFTDPHLGCLGGVPNTRGRSFFERARLAEVLINHGYYAIANTAIDGQVAIPGMFAVYHSDLVRQLGGFAFGLNGEDSDMSMRIGELGYRIQVDPQVRYESEVPASYAHMREQRMRWFRSAFHITARCREATEFRNPSLRGWLVLPIMLLNTAVRTMGIPLVIFGLIELLEPFDTGPRPLWTAVAAVILGAPTLVALGAVLINKTPRAILYLPEYTVFRMMRAYFTLESMLSIKLSGRQQKSPIQLPELEQITLPLAPEPDTLEARGPASV